MKPGGFFILLSILSTTFTHAVLYSEEMHKNQTAQNSVVEEIEPEEVQSRMDNPAQRGIASTPNDPSQILEFDKREKEKAKQSRKELFYKCVRGKEFRWMRLYYAKTTGKCKTEYSKDGEAKQMGTAYSYESCESVVHNIKSNLETAGYSCEERTLVGALEVE